MVIGKGQGAWAGNNYAASSDFIKGGCRGYVLGVLCFGLERTCARRRGADLKLDPPVQFLSPPRAPLAHIF